MAQIARRSVTALGALPVVMGVLASSPGHLPAGPPAGPAVVRAGVVQAQQPLADRSLGMAGFVAALSVGDQPAAEVVQPATFIHHMVISRDSASDGWPPQLIVC